MTCKTPRCEEEATVAGSYKNARILWCRPCAVRLGRFRVEIEAGAEERRRQTGIRGRSLGRRCVVIDCDTPAKPGGGKCLHHLRHLDGLDV